MYQYPSISGPNKAPHEHCIAFYKHDGSNLRFEWQPKKGWCKYGTRHLLFDHTHDEFGKAIEMFKNKYASDIEKIIRDDKIMRMAKCVTVFLEFEGPRSFAGRHHPEDVKDLILLDAHVHKKGIMGPTEFLKRFGHLQIPRIVYEGVLNQTFIEDVKTNKFDLKEGVVCKGGSGHGLWMRKIKTTEYRERLKSSFGPEWEKYWE